MKTSVTSALVVALVAGLVSCAPAEKYSATPAYGAASTSQTMTKAMPSARNIYYEPPAGMPGTPTPPAQQQVAVRFWVELHPRAGGGPQTVTADHIFYSGDRTRFRVATNVDCYVYVAYEGSLGDRNLLFPSINAGMDNQVQRHADKAMPSTSGYFTMDNNPGQEHVVVVCSPTRIPELDAIVRDRQANRALELTPDQNRQFSQFLEKHTGEPSGASTRNIVYEPENSGPQVGGYYTQPAPGFNEPVIINITLNHR